RTSEALAKSDRGAKVDCGNGPPQPSSQSAAEVNHHRYRSTGAKILACPSGKHPTIASPGVLVPPEPYLTAARSCNRLHPPRHTAGGGMVTIRDVARAARVSVATVSRVQNESSLVTEPTRRRVRTVARRLGYPPPAAARSLSMRRTSSIGVPLPRPDRGVLRQAL